MMPKHEGISYHRVSQETADQISRRHEMLTSGRLGGARANFAYADLTGIDLSDRQLNDADFTGAKIDLDLIKLALRDLFALQDKLVTIDNIQRSVAEYYKIKMADMLSKRRTRSVARPRQVAMTLSKELTNHSLPEIGDAFGGRDHTTVMHGVEKIKSNILTSEGFKQQVVEIIRHLNESPLSQQS